MRRTRQRGGMRRTTMRNEEDNDEERGGQRGGMRRRTRKNEDDNNESIRRTRQR
jgi:hypothetical protein